MARKAIVDKDIILDMLKQGETTQHIAERFNVSRQAIDLHRKAFIKSGLLEDRRAVRKKKSDSRTNLNIESASGDAGTRQAELLPGRSQRAIDTISLDDQIDILINAFSALKRIPQLERDLATYKRENERIKKEMDRLKQMEHKRLEQENRWMLIQTDSDGDSN